jgi:hypothetical protein
MALAVVLVVLGAGLARAEIEQKGNLRVAVSGKLVPHSLPRTGMAPVSVSVSGQISTTDETEPPHLRKLTIEINHHGQLDSTGLPICEIDKIQPASNGRALAGCRKSLVGEGKFVGTLALPGQEAPYPIAGRLLVFNGKKHGKPVLLGHIFTPKPFPTSFVLTFEISSQRHGPFGTTLTANITKALGNKRNLTGLEMKLSRRYSYRGVSRSYISAGCPAPKGVHAVSFPFARTSFAFAGTTLTSTLERSCGVR